MTTARQSFDLQQSGTNPLSKNRKKRAEDLYRRYGAIVYSRCVRFLKDPALAQDATQDVFIRVMSHLESAPDDAAAIWWIYRISANRCLTLIRNRSTHAVLVDELPERAGPHPEAALLDRELAKQVLNRTPRKLRSAAILYFLEGHEQGRIAKLLGVSKRTVINRLNDFLSRSSKFLSRDGLQATA